jgi:integrase
MRTVTRKTGAPVALPGEALKQELERVTQRHRGAEGFIMPEIAARYARDPSGVSDWVGRYFKRAGLKTSAKEKGWSKARPDASYHSLRHTFVTRAIEAGVAAPIVRALVGHNTAAMTDRYTHVGEAAILEAFGKIAERK